MKFYCISDNVDTKIGMRLAGIEGVVVHEAEEIEKALLKAYDNSEISIILITEKLINKVPSLVYELKLNRPKPLIVEIPDRHGTSHVSEAIALYVKEAVGIKI
jgi:V/A-type H+-transporting ATPase subunit F